MLVIFKFDPGSIVNVKGFVTTGKVTLACINEKMEKVYQVDTGASFNFYSEEQLQEVSTQWQR